MLVVKTPVNSRPLYRILTGRSRLGFGKYAEYTIDDILSMNEEYVVWLYSTNPQISLRSDLLERLGLPQIPKPGIDEGVLEEYHRKKASEYTAEQKERFGYRIAAVKRNKKKKALARAEAAENLTAGELQAINHGRRPSKNGR